MLVNRRGGVRWWAKLLYAGLYGSPEAEMAPEVCHLENSRRLKRPAAIKRLLIMCALKYGMAAARNDKKWRPSAQHNGMAQRLPVYVASTASEKHLARQPLQ